MKMIIIYFLLNYYFKNMTLKVEILIENVDKYKSKFLIFN